MEVNILIGCTAAICGTVFGYLAMQARIKGETRSDGIAAGQLRADIDYIKRGSDSTLLELRSLNQTVNCHADRLARVEESTKQAHHRINELREEMGKDAASKV
jgi:ABC-type transporter Mla subunit MlaD